MGDGKVLTDEAHTASPVAALEVVDAIPVEEKGSSIINVRLMDETGVPVPGHDADRLVHFEVKHGVIIRPEWHSARHHRRNFHLLRSLSSDRSSGCRKMEFSRNIFRENFSYK